MGETEVKVQISLERTVLREWKEVNNSNLPEILNSLKHLKESVNDFLTHVICKTKNSRGKEFLGEIKKLNNVELGIEDEDLEEDPLSEILKKIVNANERNSKNEDIRKNCYNSQPKRIKKLV